MTKLPIKIEIGQRFHKLIIIRELEVEERPDKGARYCLFKCDCGSEKIIRLYPVIIGQIKSCKCFVRSRGGISDTAIGNVWGSMRNRCYDPKNQSYIRYGGRGITVCDEWRNNIVSFYNWCNSNGYKKGLELDRIDNDKGYSPDNCRFVTPMQNSRNKRNNIWVLHNGENFVLKDYAKIMGVDYKAIHNRVKYKGFTPEKAAQMLLSPTGDRRIFKDWKP